MDTTASVTNVIGVTGSHASSGSLKIVRVGTGVQRIGNAFSPRTRGAQKHDNYCKFRLQLLLGKREAEWSR